MADKVWLKSYPPGVPAEIDYHQFSSIKHLFESCCAKYGDKTAYANLGHRMSYSELEHRTREFAAFLQSLPGIERGDRVAVMMPNLLQYPVAIFGILRAGLVVVNVNPLYTPRELEHQLKDSGAKAIVIIENFCKTLQEVIHETPIKHVVTTQVGDLIPAPKDKVVNPMGEWNHARILSQGKHVEFWLNGKKTVEFDRGSDDFRARVAASKFKSIPNFGEWADGPILLQEHGSEVSFRNIKIRELPAN